MVAYQQIASFALFAQADGDVVQSVLSGGAHIKTFAEGEMVCQQGEPCLHIGFVLQGEVLMQHEYPSGRMVAFERLEQGDTMAAALLYLHMPYPATAWAQTHVEMLFVPREVMTQLLHKDAQVMQNFITLLSARTMALHDAVRLLSQKGVLQKVALLLLDLAQQQGTLSLTLPMGRAQMAERLGAPRPSVSRAMAHLRDQGWIDFEGRRVTILNSAALEELVE